jgi:adenine deaminase
MQIPQDWIPSSESAERLRAAAARRIPPDLVVSGARVLNVFNGRLEDREIGISEGRIAWILESAPVDAPRLDLRGQVIVPGLIEPHAHPDVLYGPLAMAAAAVQFGTTTLCGDLLTFCLLLEDPALESLLDACRDAPARLVWALRPSAEGGGPPEDRLADKRLTKLMHDNSSIVSIGEMTSWRALVEGDRRLQKIVAEAQRRGLRVNGHLPGASTTSLQRAAVAGVSDDHEATTAQEALARLDLGFWTMIRHSSLRPDARRIVSALVGYQGLNRAMLTTDGSVAEDLTHGHLDVAVREVVAGGLDPVDAIRMATINPASYLGLDQYVGSVGPGRFADLVVVEDLADFHPHTVIQGGKPVSVESLPAYPEAARAAPFRQAALTEDDLRAAALSAPTIRLEGVISRLTESQTPSGSMAVLVARDGRWMVALNVANVSVLALASSFTGTGDVLLLGEDAKQLIAAYHKVVEIQGGIVTPTRVLPLPLFGVLSDLDAHQLAPIVAGLSSEVNLPGGDIPLEFLLLFLTLGVLPDVRLTPGGVLQVKTGDLVGKPIPLTPE